MSLEVAEILKNQRTWLDKICEKNIQCQKIILVKCIEGKTPDGADPCLYSWMPYKDVMHKAVAPIYTRGILRNELLFDPDVKNWNTLRSETNKIVAFCRKEGVPLYLGYTGGNGIHGDVFFGTFGIDTDNFNNAKKYDIDLYKIVRNVLIDIILSGAGTTRALLALDSKKIAFSKDRMGSQVREYGTTRPDGHYKTLIQDIPETKAQAQELPLLFPEKIEIWDVPQKYNIQINDAIRQELKRSEESSNYNMETTDLRGNKITAFPCLNRLFKYGAVSGSRYYGASSITLMAKRCGLNWQSTTELIKRFFTKCEITPIEAQERIENNKSLFDNPDYNFSCRTVKDVFGNDICEFSKCVISEKVEKIKKESEAIKGEEVSQRIKDEANRRLDEGNALDFLMKTCRQFHVGDETTIKATFGAIGTQSILNSSGIQPKVSGGSGKGKSHAEKAALHMVPRECVEETSLSGKALFHANIKPGTIIFSDDADPSEDIQTLIKRCTTNFQDVTKHKISVREDGEWTTKTVMVPPRIIFVLTSVADNGPIEYLNRQFNLGVDESTNQDNRVWDHLVEKAVTGEADFPITDNVLICREIMRIIKGHLFTVRIPYARRIVFNDKQNRRNGSQFLDFIRSFTVFNFRLRPMTDENTIDANEDDFREALTLYSQRAPNQKLKLNDNEIEILKKMTVGEPYTIEKLQQLTEKSYKTIYNIFNGRDGKSGLLEKVPGLTYKPETEFIGQSEVIGEGEYEREYTTLKKTKPKHVFYLMADFNSLSNFNSIATLKPDGAI